jgi:hypothetical protein
VPRLSASSTPANQARLALLLNQYSERLNALGRYSASVVGSSLDVTSIFAPVDFFKVSPGASAGNVAAFCAFVGQNPPQPMVDDYAQHAGDVGNPTHQFRSQLTERLADANRSFPDKLQVLQNALSQVHRNALPDIFENVILPWFFDIYPNGRVIAATQTAEGSDYEFLLRNLVALTWYGFEVLEIDANRRKPFMDLLQPLDARIENIIKLCLQYNGPFIDGFCLRGIFSVFVFIPNESVHRRSFRNASIFDILAPYSSAGTAGDVYEEEGQHDTIRAIHPKRTATEIEDWVRYWLNRANATLDRLYNLCRADDGAGNIDLDEYVRGILQFERIFFEITWSCSMLDQFLRKVVTYAVKHLG